MMSQKTRKNRPRTPRRWRRPNGKSNRDRHNQPHPTQCQPKDQQDGDGADKNVGCATLTQAGEFRVSDRNWAGQSQVRAEVRCQLGALGGVAHARRSLSAGLQCTVVQLCQNVDETADLVRSSGSTVPKSLPGKISAPSSHAVFNRARDQIEGSRGVVERNSLCLNAG